MYNLVSAKCRGRQIQPTAHGGVGTGAFWLVKVNRDFWVAVIFYVLVDAHVTQVDAFLKTAPKT